MQENTVIEKNTAPETSTRYAYIVKITGLTGELLSSGILVDSSHILTCYHSVDGDYRHQVIHVHFSDDTVVPCKSGKVLFHSTSDLALLELEYPVYIQPIQWLQGIHVGELRQIKADIQAVGYRDLNRFPKMQSLQAFSYLQDVEHEQRLDEIQLEGGASHGFSGGPALIRQSWHDQVDDEQTYGLGMCYLGGEGSDHTRIIAADKIIHWLSSLDHAPKLKYYSWACYFEQDPTDSTGSDEGVGSHQIPNQVGANPYKGLETFTEEDEKRFFGREAVTLMLLEKYQQLNQQLTDSPGRLLAIIGPSGTGKSSIAKAGLLPRIRRSRSSPSALKVISCKPHNHPLESLAKALATSSKDSSVTLATQVDDYIRLMSNNNNGLRRIANNLSPNDNAHILILVDQFEETFSLCQDIKERRSFVENLLEAVQDKDGTVSVVLTLRSDFLGQTLEIPALSRMITCNEVIIPAMSEAELKDAIVKPAEAAETPYKIDEAVVEQLLLEAKQHTGTLPLIQFTLTEIWEGLRVGIAPAQTLKNIGGVGGALAAKAQALYDSLAHSPQQQKIIQHAFLGMVNLGEGTRDTRRRTPLSSLVAHDQSIEFVKSVLQQFSRQDMRLITFSKDTHNSDDGDIMVEVTHEALFDHWQLLKQWIDSRRNDLRFKRRLEDAANHWSNNSKVGGLLWQSPNLDLLCDYYENYQHELTQTELEFYDASMLKKRRGRLLQWGTIATLVLLTVLAGSGAYWADIQKKKALAAQLVAEEAQKISRSQELAAYASSELEKNPTVSFRLAEAAYNVSPTSAAKNSLGAALRRPLQRAMTLLDATGKNISVAPNGKSAILLSKSGKLTIWDLESPKSDNLLIGKGNEIKCQDANYSWDGESIVTISWDNNLRIWNTKTGQLLQTIKGLQARMKTAAFSPDNKYIIVSYEDGTARVWHTKTSEITQVLNNHSKPLTDANYSPNGQWIATSSRDSTIKIWNAETGKQAHTLKGHHGVVNSAQFSTDSSMIVTSANDQTARIWDVATGETLNILEGHTAKVNNAYFSHDNAFVLTSSDDATAKIWNKATGLVKYTISGHVNYIHNAVFLPKSKFVLSISDDWTVRYWDVGDNLNAVYVRASVNDRLKSVSYSLNGQKIITSNEDFTAQIWDAKNGNSLHLLVGHKNKVLSAKFSPDGNLAVTASKDDTARIWDTNTGKNLHVLTGHTATVEQAIFSPNGEEIVTVSSDHTARIWNISSGKTKHTLKGHLSRLLGAEYSLDGNTLLTYAIGNNAKIWSAKTGKLITTFKSSQQRVTTSSFSPNNREIVTGSYDGSIRIWNIITGQLVHTIKGHDSTIWDIAYSPDGSYFATASVDSTARIWNSNSGKLVHTLKGHNNAVLTVNYSKDGDKIVTSSQDNTAKVWNIKTGKLIPLNMVHDSYVIDAMFSPNNQFIVTASYDGSACIWSLSNNNLQFTLKENKADLYIRNDIINTHTKTNTDLTQAIMPTNHDFILKWMNNKRVRQLSDVEKKQLQYRYNINIQKATH